MLPSALRGAIAIPGGIFGAGCFVAGHGAADEEPGIEQAGFQIGAQYRHRAAELEAGGTFDARRAECDAQIRNRRRRRVAGEAALDTHRADLFAFILGAAQQLGEGGEARIGEVEGEVVASAAGKIGEIAGDLQMIAGGARAEAQIERLQAAVEAAIEGQRTKPAHQFGRAHIGGAQQLGNVRRAHFQAHIERRIVER